MAHSHGDSHGEVLEGLSDRRIGWTVALNALLTVGEIVGGALAGSTALVADALHNLNDAAALLITLFARRVSRKQADEHYTFGYQRAKVIGGLINLVALGVVGLFLAYESVPRFFQPRDIGGWIVIGAAVLALVVDVLTVLLLYALRKGSVNTRSAFVHNLVDAFASVAVLLGGVAILVWDIRWIDPLLSLGISAYILYQGYKMIPKTVRLLMESAPDDLDFEKLVADMKAVEGVQDVHHVHGWQLSEEDTALEAHIVISQVEAGEMMAVKAALRQRLEVVPGVLAFTYLANRGAAWGLFDGGVLPLTLLRAAVALALLIWLWRRPQRSRLQRVAFALIAGGALGNALDGIVRGFVVDTLLSHTLSNLYRPFFGTDFPIFNLADVGVVTGVTLLLIDSFFARATPVSEGGA